MKLFLQQIRACFLIKQFYITIACCAFSVFISNKLNPMVAARELAVGALRDAAARSTEEAVAKATSHIAEGAGRAEIAASVRSMIRNVAESGAQHLDVAAMKDLAGSLPKIATQMAEKVQAGMASIAERGAGGVVRISAENIGRVTSILRDSAVNMADHIPSASAKKVFLETFERNLGEMQTHFATVSAGVAAARSEATLMRTGETAESRAAVSTTESSALKSGAADAARAAEESAAKRAAGEIEAGATKEAAKAAESKGLFKKFGDFLDRHPLLGKTASIAEQGLVVGFAFLFPGWIMAKLQADMASWAQKQTIKATQYFGGVWMQVPGPLLQGTNYANTFYVYNRVLPEYPGNFRPSEREVINLGWSTADMHDVHRGTEDNTNFFVTSGAGYQNCGQQSWGTNGIPSNNFANQMLHLNTGLEFLADGTPVNSNYPARQLLGDADAANNCNFTISKYLHLLSAFLKGGTPFRITYDMNSRSGMYETSGGYVEKGSGLEKYSKQMSDLLSAKFDTDVKATTDGQPTAIQFLGSSFGLPADSVTPLFTLKAAQLPSAATQKSLGFSNIIETLTPNKDRALNPPINAYGAHVYQTADTNLAKTARRSLQPRLQTQPTFPVNDVYDYVVVLNESLNPIPGFIPFVHVPEAGPQSEKDWGYISYKANPDAAYIYSLVDNSVYGLTGTKAGQLQTDKPVDVNNDPVIKAAFTTLPNIKPLIDHMRAFITSSTKKGPFAHGKYILTLPQELETCTTNCPAIYAIDPKFNNNQTTLENNSTDYVVPLTSGFQAVSLPSAQVAYFASLVSSRIYNSEFVVVDEDEHFNLLVQSDPPAAYVIKNSELSQFPNLPKACNNCSDLVTPLGTLYMEWDLNPYNKNRGLEFLSQLTQAIREQLKKSNRSDIQAIATIAATRLVHSLEYGGLFPASAHAMETRLGASKNTALEKIGAEAAKRIVASIGDKHVNQDNIFDFLDADKNPLVKEVFKDFGDRLRDVLSAQEAGIFNSMAQNLGKLDDTITYSVWLAQNRFIPLEAAYIYRTWRALAPAKCKPETPDSTIREDSLECYLNINAKANKLDNTIKSTHKAWKEYLSRMPENEWLLYQAVGPFAFTTKLVSNISIFATGINDIKKGFYIYQSTNFPGDYFVVASKLSGTTIARPEEFDPTHPQPYLISLITGTVYRRDPANDNILPAQDAAGNTIILSNLEAIKSSLQNSSVGSIIGSTQASARINWPLFNFAHYLLTSKPTLAAQNINLYMDVTSVPNVEEWKKTANVNAIPDFFVAAKKTSTGNIGQIGMALEAKADYIISLVTGIVYDINGATNIGPSVSGTQTAADIWFQAWPAHAKFAQADKQARARIARLAGQYAKSQNPPIPVTALPPTPSLSPDIVKALLAKDDKGIDTVAYLRSPFGNLKYYGGKYYGVLNGPVQAIIDYNQEISVLDAKNKIIKRNVALQFNNQGRPVITYRGHLLDSARAKAGISIVDGAEKLGIPNLRLNLDVKSATFSNFKPALAATLTSKESLQYPGKYTLRELATTDRPGTSVIATYAPAQSAAGDTSNAYVDMYSGDVFNTDGSGRLAHYDVLENKKDNMIFSITGRDDAGITAFGAAPDGHYYAWHYTGALTSQITNAQVIGLQADRPAGITTTGQIVIGVGPTITDPITKTLSLDLAKPITVTPSGKIDSASPERTYNTSRTPQQLRSYTYVGSYEPTGPDSFVYNPNTAPDQYYMGKKLFTTGTGAGDSYTISRVFVASTIVDISASSPIPAGSYVECTASGTSYKAVNIPDSLSYSITGISQKTDGGTGAHYLILQDAVGKHFYMPDYQSIDGNTLKAVQNKLNAYVSITAYGDVGMIKPLPGGDAVASTLEPVAAILDVPADRTSDAQRILTSGKLLFDRSTKRYIYAYDTGDSGKIYYRSTAAYADMRSGILFDARGIPTGNSLLISELQLLLIDNRITVPTPFDSAFKYVPPTGLTVVPANAPLTATTPFVRYDLR